jgi:predicted membrane protein
MSRSFAESKGPANSLAESRFAPTRGRFNQTLLRRIEFMIIVVYSLVVMGSAIPFFADISNVPVIFYYLFVPGYCVTRFFNEGYPMVQRALFSALISITVILAVFSMRQTILVGVRLPYDLLVPVFALVILLFSYYHPKR